jgi:hypothetical protein
LEILNIPFINLRIEFQHYYDVFQKQNIEEIIDKNTESLNAPISLLPIQTREMLLTLILQRVVLGFEAFYTGAVSEIFVMREMGINDLERFRKNPREWAIRRAKKKVSYCNAAFVITPQEIDLDFPLNKRNSPLYDKVSEFYKDVRNKLFHGCQFSKIETDEVRDFLQMYKSLYDWLCDWVHSEYEAFEKKTGSPIPKNDIIRSTFARDFST